MTNHVQPLTTRGWVPSPRAIAIAGGVLGVAAFWSTIPPFTARSPVVPIVIGVLAVAAGIWATTRGARRIGIGAIAAGVIGIGLGVVATRSSSSNLNTVFTADLIAQILAFATPLTFGALGGMVSERSGVVNVGLEGMMLMGAFWGVYVADKSGSWAVGILGAMVAGGLFALIHAVWSIHFRADQIISGMAINFLALGVTGYFFEQLYGQQNIPSGVSTVPNVRLPVISRWHFLGPAIGNLNLLIWVGILLVPLSYVILFKTPIGLRVRACGEHPRAADTVGIDVYKVRYAAVTTSGMLAALGGAFLSIGYLGGSFTENMTEGRGFIALAAMIFGNWRPFGAWGAALLFGFSTALAYRLPVYSGSAATLFQTLPYVLTLIAVAGVIGRSVPPAADGRPYVKQ
ncbi:MAG: ABC transporter permease [Actinobacteria bacterium]|nr:ABC transporter permease [Actinomycetota bacterium]MBV8394801.1 ABC transporter permease [Actinomycetota bacterium]MBV8597694.1 ABC transporter permease [Actinomycetota bacterium]